MANVPLTGEAASTHPNGGIGWDGNLMANPWWLGSVGEAIFLIGAERNADKVIGACYVRLGDRLPGVMFADGETTGTRSPQPQPLAMGHDDRAACR